jgi:hypothetical protein
MDGDLRSLIDTVENRSETAVLLLFDVQTEAELRGAHAERSQPFSGRTFAGNRLCGQGRSLSGQGAQVGQREQDEDQKTQQELRGTSIHHHLLRF